MRAHKLLRVRCWLLMCCARLNGDLRKHSDGFGSPAHKLSSDVGRQSSLRSAGGGQGQCSCISRPVITVAFLGSNINTVLS